MTKRSMILAALALLGLSGFPALAQTANKTWVSSASGNDTGACQFVSPCKTFAYAITQTAAGGELDVKDAGSYGVVTITKAISIVADGVLAAIAVPSGAIGITISAGANDKVVLQGLVIDGHGVGADGILGGASGTLTIIDCHFRNLTNNGIVVQPFGSSVSTFSISDTEIGGNNSGISIHSASGSMKNVNVHDNGTGVYVTTNNIMITDSNIVNNTSGIEADSGGTIIIGGSTVANNGTGIIVNSNDQGTVGSYGNNYINQNGTDINGTLASVGPR